jgi:hypothetical protein
MTYGSTAERLAAAKGIPDVFEAVKEAVRRVLGRERAGLMVVTQEIGNMPGGFLGAYFVVGANAIVVNQTPLRRIKETEPALYIPWLFGVLLHEYLHALGIIDEKEVRVVTNRVAGEVLGPDHPATKMAANPMEYIGTLAWPHVVWQPEDAPFEIVKGLDRDSTSYIQ